MRELLTNLKAWILAAALVTLAGVFFSPAVSALARKWRGSCRAPRWVFLLAVLLATMYGGAKHKVGGITYPFTDPEVKYLTDAGSYVTNDAVHVAFTRIIAPSSAPLLIDRRQIDQTNDVDWVNFTNTTFAAFNQPQTIPFPAATNFDWIVYTTWTPGPTVQTNGVWHAFWGKDRKTRAYLIPVRTCVRDGATVIATPKSVWVATNETTEVTQ